MISIQQGPVAYKQFSVFQDFPELIHGIFTRQGGISPAPYASLNVASHPLGGKDTFENATHNRQLILRTLGLDGHPSLNLWQVHGAQAVTFQRADAPLWRTDWHALTYYDRSTWTTQVAHKADALITQERGYTLALGFADCTPILFYDPVQKAIANTHAGWRGTARGVALETVKQMQRHGSRLEDIHVGIGPAIGGCCYEVSQEVYEHFMGITAFEDEPTRPEYQEIIGATAQFSYPNGRLHLDPAESNRQQLIALGIRSEQIENAQLCTSCHVEEWFSHRREQGQTGRFAAVIALRPL